jgi:Fur family ferric uptake transcriptional regulator
MATTERLHAASDATLLRAAGLKATTPRLAVLQTLTHGSHLPAEAITAQVREITGGVSTQAVYDVLHALTAAGLIRQIEPAGSAMLYERRTGDNHHHLVCRGCGRVEDVDCAVGYTPCLEAADGRGYLIDEAEVTYWGRCPDCRADGAPAAPGSPK